MQKVSIASFLDDAIRLTSRTIYWSTVGQLYAWVVLCILQSASKVSFDALQYSSDVTYVRCQCISYSTVMIFIAANDNPHLGWTSLVVHRMRLWVTFHNTSLVMGTTWGLVYTDIVSSYIADIIIRMKWSL